MRASQFVGRVGGLALGLGVGAMLYTGAVASADSDSPATEGRAGAQSASGHSSAGPRARKASAPVTAGTAARTQDQTSAGPARAPRASSALAVPAETRSDGSAAVTPPSAAATTAVRPAAAATPLPDGCTRSSAACAIIMGPSGVPFPSGDYAAAVDALYIQPNLPGVQFDSQVVFTPEGAYPATGIKVLPLPISADQGQEELEYVIQTLQPGNTPSIPMTLFGFSQSAVITSRLQRDLYADPTLLPGLDRDQLTFITVGQEMNPNGGWFARFPGLNTPSLGEFFYGSTGYISEVSAGDPQFAYPLTNYTLQYDGFADSPRYAGNFLSSLNAAMGILLVHTQYANPAYFYNTYLDIDYTLATKGPGVACGEGGPDSACMKLPVKEIPGLPTPNYYFIQTPNLPLLAPLRAIPLIGQPLAALIQPVLRVIVDLGYADPAHGFYSATQPDANVAMPFGILPNVNPLEVIQRLIDGVVQGVGDFVTAVVNEISGIGRGLLSLTLPSPPSTDPAGPPAATGDFITTVLNVIDGIDTAISTVATWISASASAAYATLLATADFVNAAVFTLPAYDASLFLEGITQAITGDPLAGLINAIGRPIAADIGLASTIVVIQLAVWLSALAAVITGCGPSAPTAWYYLPGVKIAAVCGAPD